MSEQHTVEQCEDAVSYWHSLCFHYFNISSVFSCTWSL